MSKETPIKNQSNSPPEYSKKIGDYILLEQIGQGTFSKVSKGFHTITEQIVAVKIMDKKKIEDEIDIERIQREIEILRYIHHPNICQMYETYTTIHNYYLMMEYVEGGDLFDYISENSYLSERKACYFFRQLISAMEYLSSLSIVHRDIKPENILLNSDHTQIKLIDFGLSNYNEKGELLQSSCGSPCYASPEMLSGKPYCGLETDIWSAGIVLYSMLVGGLPFDDVELKNLYTQIKEGKFYIPSTLSLEAIDLLKKILRIEPYKRITIKEMKEHPWFNLEKNVMYKGVNLFYEKMPCDMKVVQYIIKKFFSDDNISLYNYTRMIKNYACNKYTATYYLVKKYILVNKDDTNDIKEKIEDDNYKKVYKEIKEAREEIKNVNKNNNINNKKLIIKRNKRNISNNLYYCDDINITTPSNKQYNYLNLRTKEDSINRNLRLENNNNNNINTLLSENNEKKIENINKNIQIKIQRKKIENCNNNLVLFKTNTKLKNNKNNYKNNKPRLKLGLSLINIIGVNNKQKLNENNLTDRNIAEKCKYSNYISKIYSYTNSNMDQKINKDSNSLNKIKKVNKKNIKLKTYLNKIISPKKGDLNFYVINNIINKDKQIKKKRTKNELFNLEINSNINKKNYLSNVNNKNIIVNINNNNYINNSLNKNHSPKLNIKEIIGNRLSPTNKIRNKNNNISSQIKVNLKSSKKEMKFSISPKNRIITKKPEKNSSKKNYKLDIYKFKKGKTLSPTNELNIRINSNKNRTSNLIKFNTNVLTTQKKEKNFINTNITNNYVYRNIITNKEKLNHGITNHRKIKSFYNQDNSLFDYFYENKNKNSKNNFHKRNITSITYLNSFSNNNTLSNSEEKILNAKIMYKPKNQIQKKKMNYFNLNSQNNKNNDLNSFIIDKSKRNKLMILNNINTSPNNNYKNNNNKNYIGLTQSNSTNNYFLMDNFH